MGTIQPLLWPASKRKSHGPRKQLGHWWCLRRGCANGPGLASRITLIGTVQFSDPASLVADSQDTYILDAAEEAGLDL